MRRVSLLSLVLAPAALAVTLTGCAMPTIASGNEAGIMIGAGRPPEVELDVRPVVWAAEDVFERLRIPIAYTDEVEGEVRSETMRVQHVWDGEDIRARIQCPTGFGIDPRRVYDRPFDVSVVAEARYHGSGRTRVVVSGRALGAGEPPENDSVTCTLREEFRSWIAEEIRRRAMNQPPRARPTRGG